jgi:hypothetical protein
MTQSYFEYLGRQEAAPFTNEKLDYEQTEPDLTKAVNDQIDRNIKDRAQFFQDNINRYNQTVAGKTARNLESLARLTVTGKKFLDDIQEFREDRKAFEELQKIYNDPTKRDQYATVEKNLQEVEGDLRNDEDVEIATIEQTGTDTTGQVVSGNQLLDFKKSITSNEFLNGRHAAKSMSTYWPKYLEIAKGSLLYNNKLYEDLTFSEKQEWMKVAGANFVAMFAKANPRMTEHQVITNFMPSFDSTSKNWDSQSYDVENNAVNTLRSNTSTQNYINAIKVSADAFNNPNVKSATISSVYDKSGFIQNKIAILQATGDPNPARTANKMWADMIIKNIDQFDEQDIEYLLYHDKFEAKQHAGTGKLSSYYDIQPANANLIAQAFIENNQKNNLASEQKRLDDIKLRLNNGQEVPRDVLTTFSNEELRQQAEEALEAGEKSEFSRPEFSVKSELFYSLSDGRAKELAAIQGNPEKYGDYTWRTTTTKDIYDQAGDYFKQEYQDRFEISGNRNDALEFAQKKTVEAMKNGEFDDVLSDIIEDTKIAKSLKLRKVYEADTKAALNSSVILEGEEDPVLNGIDYFNGKADKLDHTWTLLAQLYPNKGPLKLAHDRLVTLGKIKPIPSLMYDADVKVLDSPLLNQNNNATKTIIAADNGITNSENYNEMLGALSKDQEQHGGVDAIKGPDGNYVTELPLGKPLSEHTIQEVFGLVQAGYTNIGLYDMTPAALTQVFTDNIGQIDFTRMFDEKAQSKLLMARLYHKANNQHLFGNADTSYRRLMNFTEDQIEQYESMIEEIPPFMRLNTLYGPAAKEAINQNL